MSESASVGDLFALADVARLSGHPMDAQTPLKRIVAEYPADARAPLAALTLGRIQLRSLGAPAAAAVSLEKALLIGLPAGLDQDAYALLVESRATAGDRAGARAAYEQYRARFPGDAAGATLRRWVSDRGGSPRLDDPGGSPRLADP
jgi:transmembrane sensor